MRRIPERLSAWLLVLPLFLFSAGTFILPIALMLGRSVQDPELAGALPRTAQALARWDGRDMPPADLVGGFIVELRAARGTERFSFAANRLNSDIAGFRSMLLRTARGLPADAPADPLAALVRIDQRWGERSTWARRWWKPAWSRRRP